MKRLFPFALCLLSAACSGVAPGARPSVARNVPEIMGPFPQLTVSPADDALACVAKNKRKGQDLRIGIGEIVDGTGARTFTDGTTPLLTQRPDMMFAVALKKTGVRVLNRNATKVSEWELAQSMEQRLGEGGPVEIDGAEFPYRPVVAGSMLGSTHFVTGALTEVNWNIYSDEKRGSVAGAFRSTREYYISVAFDLMVTDTKTTEVVLARSYTKQIVGREISRGLFRFFEVDDSGQLGPIELFDVSSGEQRNEPVQRAVRWLVDVATYDIAATLTDTRETCDATLRPNVADAAPEETRPSDPSQSATEETAAKTEESNTEAWENA